MENKKLNLRVLFNSNAAWASSGYAQQSAEILPRIREVLEPGALAASNFFGQAGGKFMLDGILQYPVINHVYGSDALMLHGRDFRADVCFSLQDVWVLNPQDLTQVNHWIPITPIDHEPVTQSVVQMLKNAYRIITYSRFGQEQLKANGLTSTYIPHTVNTDIFKIVNKAERKTAGGIDPKTFLVGMVAANKDNPPRKSFQEVLDAFKMFLEKVPNACIYIHSNPEFPGGFNFKQYANFIGIGDKLLIPDIYDMNFNITKERMGLVYNTFDVLVAPSISEGFGIPIIEAQSCGVPVIVNDFTSMPELIRDKLTGYKTKVAYKRFSPQGSYMGIPDVQDIYNGLMFIHSQNREKMSLAARSHIIDKYDTDKIFKEKWLPFLQKLEQEIHPNR